MSRQIRVAAATLAFALLVVGMFPVRVLAHETRTVGKYEFVVGFLVEPPYEGQKNGLDLRVRLPGTPATPVTGLEKTLQVEITYVSTDKSVTKPIRAIFGDAGHYTTDILPTQPGQYRFRIFGTVEGTNVNESFTSGDKFNNVEKVDDLNFPDSVPQVRSVQGAAIDAQKTADDAASEASSARVLAIVGIALGAVTAGLALSMAMRSRRDRA